MNITMMNHYEPAHGAMLNERMTEAFGFSFADWFALGQWTEQYEVYSIIDGGRILSNVGVYKTELLVRGQSIQALQIGGVATAADCRGRGYLRRIMEHIFQKYPETPAFLHANDSVTQFYPRFGFRRVWEGKPTVTVSLDNDILPIKLRLSDERISRAMAARGVYSNVLDCVGTQTVQVFHQLMDCGDDTYLLPDLDAVVIAKQRGDQLMISDVMASRRISLDALCAHLPFAGVRRIEFGFCPDWLSAEPDWARIESDDEALFVRGDLALPDKFRFPVTSLT